jgi:hypothetical protein
MVLKPPLIPYLVNVHRWVLLMIVGGAVLLLAVVLTLIAHFPATPAHEVSGWDKAWLFLLPVVMAGYGLYVSARYWRCPQCGAPLPTERPVPACCKGCGAMLRGPSSR